MTGLDKFSRKDFRDGRVDPEAFAVIRAVGARLAHTPSKMKRCAWFKELVSDGRSEEFLVDMFIDMYRGERIYKEHGGPLDATTLKKLKGSVRIMSSANGWSHTIAPTDDFIEKLRLKLLGIDFKNCGVRIDGRETVQTPKKPPRPMPKSTKSHKSRFVARFGI